MKIYRTSPDENLHRVAREAAEWVQAMKNEPSAEERAAFLAWMEASQLHLREVLLADSVDKALARPGALQGFDLDEVLARAAQEDNVVPLHPQWPGSASAAAAPAVDEALSHGWATSTATVAAPPASRATGRARSRRVRRWGQVAAMAAVFAVGLATWWVGTEAPPSKQYASAIGEQRVIALADGSRVTLAPRSRITVDFSEGARDIELLAGEVDFKVAHDRTRPFRVHAGSSVIQAVGTQFTVNRLPSGTVVAVSEGRVKMMTSAGQGLGAGLKAWLDGSKDEDARFIAKDAQPLIGQAELAAGEAVRIASSGRVYAPVDYSDSVATISATPRLTFREDTLADIVAEFNRYNARQIVIDDDIRWQRYSGVFNANDADSFLQFLECCSNVSVARDDEQTRIRVGAGSTRRK